MTGLSGDLIVRRGAFVSLSVSDAAHLLRRSGFGATSARIAELVALGSRERAVARVMDISLNSSLPIPPFNTDKAGDEKTELELITQWWLDRMMNAPSPLHEKLTLFWHGHFATGQGKVNDMGLMLNQHQTLRTHAMGRFGDFAQAIAIDPAMLLYLDNWANSKVEPQENFGRELLELFTLGSGSYTEADVISMARAWTGHSLVDNHRGYVFKPADHDNGNKTLFGITKNWNGPDTIRETLFRARAGESSRFIVAKLFSFLAYPVTPKDPTVVVLADHFRASGLNIARLVREIFLSGEFWSPMARHALVRSPVEWYVAALQSSGVTHVPSPKTWMVPSGQVLFDPPSVAGWRGGRSWISTSGAAVRLQVASIIRQKLDARVHLSNPSEQGTSAQVIDTALLQYGITDPSPATRASLIRWVDETRARRGDALAPELAVLLLCSPDFQLA